ncbi:MAG: S1C family serine protease [Ruminococcus sp.]
MNNPYDDLYSNSNNQQNQNAGFGTDASFEPQPAEEEILSSDAADVQTVSANVPTDVLSQADTPAAQMPPEQKPCSYEWQGDNVVRSTPVTPLYTPPADARHTQQRQRKPKARTPIALIIVLCIVLSSVFGVGSAAVTVFLMNDVFDSGSSSGGGLSINQVSPDSGSRPSASGSELTTVEIVDKTANSVVEIITEVVETGSFAQQYIKSGAGSGVIVDSTGYIVTNNHVIENARKITVTLRTGESYEANLIGTDSRTDIALIKIDASDLTCAVFGNSDNLKVGERTVAIGNPLGQLGGSVTEGIISALDRDVTVDGVTMNLMQTDTAINPGNSGGGLFDVYGNLVGIVNAKSSGSEIEGLGFAIPINDVIDVMSDLMEFGYVRGRIDVGMEFIDVTSNAVAWMYGLNDLGCYVYSVDKGSNADEMGFRSGDMILKVDSVEISASDDIEDILDKHNVGDEVVFTIKRSGATGDITLKLQEDIPETAKPGSDDDDSYIQWYNYSY